MGWGRIAAAAAARGDTLDVITPETFPRVFRRHGRWWALLVPFAAAFWLWRRRGQYDVAAFHSYAGWVFNFLPWRMPTVTVFHGLEPVEYAAARSRLHASGERLSLRYRFVHGWLMRHLLAATCRRSRF